MEFDSNDTVGGYAVPVDPMDLLRKRGGVSELISATLC